MSLNLSFCLYHFRRRLSTGKVVIVWITTSSPCAGSCGPQRPKMSPFRSDSRYTDSQAFFAHRACAKVHYNKTTQDLHVLIQMPVTFKSQLIGCFTPAVLKCSKPISYTQSFILVLGCCFLKHVLSFLSFFLNSPYGVCDSFSDMVVLVQLPSECSLGFSREEKLGLKIRRTLIYVFIFFGFSSVSRSPEGPLPSPSL